MKKIFTIALLSLVVVTSSFSMADSSTTGSASAKLDTSYSIEDMLTYAIQDEYLARSEYEAIMSKFSVTRPFSNIMRSEETHIDLLIPLFDAYNIDVPVDDSSEHLIIPSTLAETYEIGVEAEINNIAMYEKFLAEDLPDDIREVFEKLMNASENHLKAFSRNADSSRGTRSFGRSSR